MILFGNGRARADLTLTAAGTAQGLSLSTFISGFPNSGIGPLGTAFANDGGVLVSDYNSGTVYRFPSDANGQVASSSLISATFGGNNPNDMAQVGGNIYMTRQGTGDLVQLNQNGTFNQSIVGGLPAATGLTADPFTGHLFVSTLGNNVIWDVDPIAKTKVAFVNASADGLSLSLDGRTLYAEVGGHVLGFDTTTKAQVFDSGFVNTADGTAVGAGLFSSLLFINTNDGRLVEVNLNTLAQTVIATGGSRGDFVTVDPTNDTLLVIQSDRIVRLSGASFVPGAPEPSSMALLLIGGLGLVAYRRHHRGRRRSTTPQVLPEQDAAPSLPVS
jgi:hypothetical protein